jgi:hypothetical protein
MLGAQRILKGTAFHYLDGESSGYLQQNSSFLGIRRFLQSEQIRGSSAAKNKIAKNGA